MTEIDFGALKSLMENDKIVRITVNKPSVAHVWHADEGMQDIDLSFADDKAVYALAEQMAASVDMPFDYQHPIMDVHLANGVRAMLISPHVSSGGTIIHIEKNYDYGLTVEKFIDFGALTQASVDFLKACIKGHARIAFVGGHHSGRMAGMNAIIRLIPQIAPTVIIQPFNTIHLPEHTNVVKLESQRASFMNVNHLDNQALLDAALRLKPHRLIIADLDGTEVSGLLTAMQNGLDTFFSMSAMRPIDALTRLETMATANNLSRPIMTIREQIADAIDLIVHIDLMTDGFQRFVSIHAIEGMQGDTINLVSIFEREQGMSGGDLVATGNIPRRTLDRLKLNRTEVDLSLFEP